MDEASSSTETSDEAVTRAREEKATPACAGAEAAVKISAREPATLISDSENSDAGRKVEIRINLGFDDQTLQTVLSSLKNAQIQPQTAEYISLTAPYREEACATRRQAATNKAHAFRQSL